MPCAWSPPCAIAWRSSVKCGIALTANPAHALNHYNTGKGHRRQCRSLAKARHRSSGSVADPSPRPLMNADEVADAFITLKQAGKIWARRGLQLHAPPVRPAAIPPALPLVTNQLEISPLHQEGTLDGALDQCQQLRIKPMAWSCLGGGRLFHAPDYAMPRCGRNSSRSARRWAPTVWSRWSTPG